MDKEAASIKARLDAIERELSTSSVNRLSSAVDKKIIEDAIFDGFMKIFWEKFYYYSTFFDGVDGFNITGTVTIDGGGAYVDTPGSGAALSNINVDVAAFPGNFSFTKPSRFRTVARFDDNDAQDIFMAVGAPTVASADAYGFFLDGATLKGFAQTAPGSRTTTDLLTIATSTNYTLDARFYPGNKVEFFVNNTPYGSVTTNLPATAGTVIWTVHVVEEEASPKAVLIGSIEYLQERF